METIELNDSTSEFGNENPAIVELVALLDREIYVSLISPNEFGRTGSPRLVMLPPTLRFSTIAAPPEMKSEPELVSTLLVVESICMSPYERIECPVVLLRTNWS